MAHHNVFVRSALLPRLLAAIGAGSLLAAPGCGGKTQATNGEVANGVDGAEQTGPDQTGGEQPAAEDSTHSNQSTFEPGRPPATPPTVTPPDDTTAGTESPTSRPVTTGETTGETTEATTSVPSVATDDSTSVSTESEMSSVATPIDAGPPGLACEFGRPQRFCLSSQQMESQARYGVGQIPLDPPRSDDEIAAAWDENGCMKHEWIATGCCNPAELPGEPQEDGTCCYVACEGACCGRPFLIDGVALTANVIRTEAWLCTERDTFQPNHDALDVRARQLLSEAWLEDARMEHASVASFARFSLDLMRLGAPPELLRDSHLAGLDEIEHARIAFSIAEQLSGVALGPDILPLGELDAHSLRDAVSAAIVEGCIGETLAAAVLAEQARQCSDPSIAASLNRIAEDELRHAELAWRFVAWSIERFGQEARVVVQTTFATALAHLPPAPTALDLTEAELRAGGRISPAAWSSVVESVIETVLKPAAQNLLSRKARAAVVGVPPLVASSGC